MSRTQWNDAEDEALRGLSMLAQLIYLRVFRRRMNYATGVSGGAGRLGRITTKTIIRELEFVPDPRSTKPAWKPTRGEIRAAIAELERARLIDGERVVLLVEAGSSQESGYVKRLPLADMDSSDQNMSNQRATQEQPISDTMRDPMSRQEKAAQAPENTGDLKTEQPNERRGKKQTFADTRARATNYPDTGIPVEERGAKAPVEFAAGEPDGKVIALTRLPSKATSQPKPDTSDAVREVFDYWRTVHTHPRAQLDSQRRTKIAARLKDGYSVADLKQAIDGCKASPFHQGKNDDKKVWDDIELICRSASKVEQFKKYVAQVKQQDAELDAWLNESSEPAVDLHVIEGEFCHVG